MHRLLRGMGGVYYINCLVESVTKMGDAMAFKPLNGSRAILSRFVNRELHH